MRFLGFNNGVGRTPSYRSSLPSLIRSDTRGYEYVVAPFSHCYILIPEDTVMCPYPNAHDLACMGWPSAMFQAASLSSAPQCPKTGFRAVSPHEKAENPHPNARKRPWRKTEHDAAQPPRRPFSVSRSFATRKSRKSASQCTKTTVAKNRNDAAQPPRHRWDAA